ncbi:uncharacterized protein METZ01_LOCUS388905 [marine metagenome]|uniref:Uncharacterized protein n=1 Tax=marine metagenome TaxID=408172 RepID=A0A382UQU1_9ZZZZ
MFKLEVDDLKMPPGQLETCNSCRYMNQVKGGF